MKYNYKPHGICPKNIEVDIEGDILKSVKFEGGCDGNLSAISKLVAGMNIKELENMLGDTKCGSKQTSCSAQLVKAIKEAVASK